MLFMMGSITLLHGQEYSLELGSGFVSPNTNSPNRFHSFIYRNNMYVPVTNTGDLIFGVGFLFYKIYDTSINSNRIWNDVLSVFYSYNFIDRSNYEGRLFAGYQPSGFIIKNKYIQKNLSHWGVLGVEGGTASFKLRISLSKAMNPLQISIDENTFKRYHTLITFSFLFY